MEMRIMRLAECLAAGCFDYAAFLKRTFSTESGSKILNGGAEVLVGQASGRLFRPVNSLSGVIPNPACRRSKIDKRIKPY
jgi:hypothetical protein